MLYIQCILQLTSYVFCVVNLMAQATESVDAEVSAISEDVQPQQAIATPARGRGRGKGRGKKAQSTPSIDQQLGAPSRSSSPHSVSAESEITFADF